MSKKIADLDLKFFSQDDKDGIILLAAGMSISEVCDYYYTSEEDLPADDLDFLTRVHKHGRAKMKQLAVEKLQQAMIGKQGLQASLAVLTRFADDWPVKEEDGGGDTQRSFTISMD